MKGGGKSTGRIRQKRGMSRPYAKEFLAAAKRARDLHERLVKNGHAVKCAGAMPKPLSQPDRRDIVEHLFFEVAAKFEQFAKRTLVLEVQKSLGVNKTRAEHMVGSSSDGIPLGMGGWAHIDKMKSRGTGLLGTTSVYAKADHHLKNPHAQYLQMAVIIRNRIAHGAGSREFTKMLAKAPVQATSAQRKGLSPGKLLLEYPKGSAQNDKWFFRLIDSYERWVKIIERKI